MQYAFLNRQKKGDKNMKEKDFYRKQITEMVKEIQNPIILMKIYTVVKTHLEILKEKERED